MEDKFTGVLRASLKWLLAIVLFLPAIAVAANSTYYSSAGQNWLYTDITGANTTIDADHTNSWTITITGSQSVPLYGGNFTIKTGGSVTDNDRPPLSGPR